MASPARAGALIYAKDLSRLSVFYQKLFSMRLLYSDEEHHIIESDDMQLIIHAIPEYISSSIVISSPPEQRSEQAIKLFFTVPSITGAGSVASSFGGSLFGQEYTGPGFLVRNGYDPEGNIFQVREFSP